jgi:prevent-host-death family protein
MNAINTVTAREHFSDVVNRSAYGKERIVLTRRNKNIAAIIPLEDYDLLQKIEDYLDIEEAYQALEEAQTKGTTPFAEFKAELNL